VESENEKALAKAKKDLENFKNISGAKLSARSAGCDPSIADELVVPEMKTVPADLSGYVTFLHPCDERNFKPVRIDANVLDIGVLHADRA
jgi:hypothetical protein